MSKSGKGKNPNPKKGKTLIKLLNKSDSDTDDSEHELSYYLDDRVKLMKEVMKIIKPKKIRSMAPKWMSNLDIKEINSMLFEELLGISNKRLKGIFNGQTQEEDSSSTDPELEDEKAVDIISLDDITDDEFIINLDSDDDGSRSKRKKTDKVKVKEETKKKKVKKEKRDKSPKKDSKKEKSDEQNLMSVLELLELQARARAIKSQLALESQKKAETAGTSKTAEISDNEDAVIIESPKDIEIIITSSESESESNKDIAKAGSSKSSENAKETKVGNKSENKKSSLDSTEQIKDKQENRVDSAQSKSNEINENNKRSGKESEKEKEIVPESLNDTGNAGNLYTERNFEIKDLSDSRPDSNDTEPQTSKAQNKIQIHNISILTLKDDQYSSTVLSTSEDMNKGKKSRDTEDNVQENVVESSKTVTNVTEDSGSKENLPVEETTNANQVNVTEIESSDKTQIRNRRKKNKTYRKRRSSNKSDSSETSSSEQQVKKLPENQEKTGEGIIIPEENEGIIINVDQSEIECISD